MRSGSPEGIDRFQAFETFAFSNASFDPLSVLLNPANLPPNNIVAGALTVNENAGNGTLVGTVTGQDPNGQVLSYTLTDNADGRFAINPVTGQITVANGILLDFEQGASHDIVVRVTDTLGASFDKAFTVGINDVNPETAFGGPGSDTLFGGPLGDFIGGSGGGDIVFGGGGNDSVVGGTGNDHFNGEGGDDFLFGSDFNPDGSFVANSGDDTLDGGDGNDGLWGADGNDHLLGGLGSDGLVGGAGNDLLDGGDGADFLFGGDFSVVDGSFVPNSGDDTLNGGNGNDGLWGFDGNDVINGDAGDDYAEGGLGNDSISGGADNDTLLGQDGSRHDRRRHRLRLSLRRRRSRCLRLQQGRQLRHGLGLQRRGRRQGEDRPGARRLVRGVPEPSFRLHL